MGITNLCPAYTKLGLARLFALAIAAYVVPYRRAMICSVSPHCTTCTTVSVDLGEADTGADERPKRAITRKRIRTPFNATRMCMARTGEYSTSERNCLRHQTEAAASIQLYNSKARKKRGQGSRAEYVTHASGDSHTSTDPKHAPSMDASSCS